MRIKKQAGSPDYLIIFCVAFLVIFGLVMLASASSYLGQTKFGDSYYYLKHQLMYGLNIGPVNFQPSELLKITFIIYLAAWLGKNIERAKSFAGGFLPFLVISAIIAGL